ncbi:hypothetical protein CTEN210_16353 [Chaetoceros tenuissimus]|uniref:JmjC domain-containing protein n=1 Tax=Chaetoceros tenuissimus TaxID=426638 RepID=A0AAD3D8I9_9STRA|nr:hypothetical protein CTEN210_16353 [Chaetoceros tenuissimus]
MSLLKPRLLNLDIAKKWTKDARKWSPAHLLTGEKSPFPTSSELTVKRSSSRFFMYEEHGNMKLKDNDGPTETIQQSPKDFAKLLHDTSKQTYYYWTSPIIDVAPSVLQEVKGYNRIHKNPQLLDPRGPSLWMGSSGSSTQAHYDVADNIIVQLYGTKRVRCYPPKAALDLYVYPDAHPRARKSQVNFDHPDLNLYPRFQNLSEPHIDVLLKAGDAMYIPAFWFHHLENGIASGTKLEKGMVDGPSVSMNMFALSNRMRVAQNIFIDSSRLFQNSSIDFDFAVTALGTLSKQLFLGLGTSYGKSFIRTHLLDTRYTPINSCDAVDMNRKKRTLTLSEEEIISNCVSTILPQLSSLEEEGSDGVLDLVLCHLFELWAVELVGASSVQQVWETVLLEDSE